MKNTQIITVILSLTLLFSCNTENKQSQSFRKEQSIVRLQITDLKIDTIFLNHPNTSYEGFLTVQANEIYFLDDLFATATIFDLNGKIKGQFLGKGEGDSEIEGIKGFIPLNDEYIITKGYSVYTFNKNWKKTKHSVMQWNSDKSVDELTNHPKPDDIGIYELKYKPSLYRIFDNEHIIMNTETTHPKFNGYFSTVSKEFYQNAHIFALLNRKTSRIDKIFGNYSDVYLRNNIPNYANWYSDITDSELYMNFEADSLVYVYDKKSLQPSFCFGRSGMNMKQNYQTTETYDKAMEQWKQDRVNNGYYTDISVFAEQDLIFRFYTVGVKKRLEDSEIKTEYDSPRRMQIYKNRVLIGDLKVPNRFKIVGKIGDYFIADGIVDDIKEKIAFYKFKIPQ